MRFIVGMEFLVFNSFLKGIGGSRESLAGARMGFLGLRDRVKIKISRRQDEKKHRGDERTVIYHNLRLGEIVQRLLSLI